MYRQSYQHQYHSLVGGHQPSTVPAIAADLQQILPSQRLDREQTVYLASPLNPAAMQQAQSMPPDPYGAMTATQPYHISTSHSLEEHFLSQQYPSQAYQDVHPSDFTAGLEDTVIRRWHRQQLRSTQRQPYDERQQTLISNDYPSEAHRHDQALLRVQQQQRQQQRQRLRPPDFFGQQGPTPLMPSQYSDPPSASPSLQRHRHHHHHHHHTLPTSPSGPPKSRDPSERLSDERELGSAPSLVGQEGMPDPAPRPKGPKLKFTPADDALLIQLKEEKGLTWKQIADFFPGRSSGTLQVRYCTKLKAKTTIWSDEMVQKLKQAMAEYEIDRWKIIAAKVGNGFTAVVCHDKAVELEMEAVGDLVMEGYDSE